MENEAIALRASGVLVETAPNVTLDLVVRYGDVAIVIGMHIQLLLISMKLIDSQLRRLEQAGHYE